MFQKLVILVASTVSGSSPDCQNSGPSFSPLPARSHIHRQPSRQSVLLDLHSKCRVLHRRVERNQLTGSAAIRQSRLSTARPRSEPSANAGQVFELTHHTTLHSFLPVLATTARLLQPAKFICHSQISLEFDVFLSTDRRSSRTHMLQRLCSADSRCYSRLGSTENQTSQTATS